MEEQNDFDVVSCAVNHMSRETMMKIVRKVIESQIRDSIRQSVNRGLDVKIALNNMAEKIQSNMMPEETQSFSKEMYESTGIDSRSARLTFKRKVDKVAEIIGLYHEHCSNAHNRKGR